MTTKGFDLAALVAAIGLFVCPGFAATAANLPTGLLTEKLYHTQLEAEAAYDAERYDEALRIYRDQLAGEGDKYAQYMIGWMLANGQGVETDLVAGAAWMKLAAQRDEEALTEAQVQMYASLTLEQRVAAEAVYEQLLGEYGDCAVVEKLLERNREQLRHLTGSRLAQNNSSPVTVIYGNQSWLIDGRLLRRDLYRRRHYLKKECQ